MLTSLSSSRARSTSLRVNSVEGSPAEVVITKKIHGIFWEVLEGFHRVDAGSEKTRFVHLKFFGFFPLGEVVPNGCHS